jgi:hypothetical protein
VHISKVDAYDGNKNITISIYQILVSISQGLQWLFNTNIFKIVSNIMSKTSQNIMFTLRIATSMVNDVEHVMQIRLENTVVKEDPSMFRPSHNTLFIDLCDSSNDDGMLSNSSHPLMSFPLIELGLHKVHESIPCLASTSTSFVLSFIDYLQAMVIALHFAFELRSLTKLNY